MIKIATFLLCLTALIACGQEKPVTGLDFKKFNSKYVRLIEDTNKMMLIQDVRVTYGDLYVEADSALLDRPRQSLTAYGIKNLQFKGKSVNKEEFKSVVRYRLGESKYYTE